MAKVRIEPSGTTFDVGDSETVFSAALRHGIQWPSGCGGDQNCGLCVMQVVATAVPLPPPSPKEAHRIASNRSRDGDWKDGCMRLACTAIPLADMTVFKRIGSLDPKRTASPMTRAPGGRPGFDRADGLVARPAAPPKSK